MFKNGDGQCDVHGAILEGKERAFPRGPDGPSRTGIHAHVDAAGWKVSCKIQVTTTDIEDTTPQVGLEVFEQLALARVEDMELVARCHSDTL